MTQKKTESGRSMVEMLGVLAVIGVLSVGGISGYKMAMKKNVENDYLNFLQYLKLMVDTEFQNEENTFTPTIDLATKDAIRERNEILCTYLPSNYCQEYINPKTGGSDTSYFMSDHFYWQIAQYISSFSASTAARPKGSEFITINSGYKNHHPDLEKDVDLCKNLVNAIANTFGEQFGGFNSGSVGITKDAMLTRCEEGVGMQPFSIIISVPAE